MHITLQNDSGQWHVQTLLCEYFHYNVFNRFKKYHIYLNARQL